MSGISTEELARIPVRMLFNINAVDRIINTKSQTNETIIRVHQFQNFYSYAQVVQVGHTPNISAIFALF